MIPIWIEVGVSYIHPDWSACVWQADRCFGNPSLLLPWHCAAVLAEAARTAALPLIPGETGCTIPGP